MVLIAAGGIFALDMSVGGGLLFDFSGNNGVEASGSGVTFYMGYRTTSFGAFGFFDLTYAEINVSLAYGSATYIEELSGMGNNDYSDTGDGGSLIQLGFTALGKYPIDMGSFTLFPLAGFSYNMVISASGPDGSSDPNPGDYSQFGILGGIGADFSLSDSLFIRAEALFQLRFSSEYQDLLVTAAKLQFGNSISVDDTLGMGPRIKVAVGYRL